MLHFGRSRTAIAVLTLESRMTLHYHVRLTFLASLMNLSELLLEYEPLQGRDRV